MDYEVTNQWPGGFQAEVEVINTSGTQVDGWELEWSFTAGQQISQLWNADWDQTGSDVTVGNVSWNNLIQPNGGSVSFGFLGSWNGSNPEPSTFTLNGTNCQVQ